MALRAAVGRRLPSGVKRGLKAALGLPETRLNADWNVLEAIGPVRRAHIVLDIGAHHGWFFHCWLDWCPEAKVHAFEPSSESFETMSELYGADARVRLNRVGVGAQTGEMRLNVLTQSKVSNSFLEPEPEAWTAIEYETGRVEQESVAVTTLDEYCAGYGIDEVYLVKIDVQGYEREVLKGGRSTLAKTDYVFVESGIERLYDGAPSFADVFLDMEKRGFHLMTMRAWHRGNHRLVETDMLFRRNDLVPEIDRNTDRHYVELR